MIKFSEFFKTFLMKVKGMFIDVNFNFGNNLFKGKNIIFSYFSENLANR